MQIRQLEAFRAIMELGSVTRAAAALGVSQPAVSKLLAALTEDCGFELFVRTGNRLEATAEAASLYREVERMFRSVGDIERHAAAIRERRAGQLSIGAFPALATRPLPAALRPFRMAHSDVRLSLIARSGRLLGDLVSADRIDVGIGLMRIDVASIRSELLGSVEAVCAMAPDNALVRKRVIQAEDLDGLPFISLGSEDQARYRVDAAFSAAPIHRDVVIEAHQSEAACAFAASGAGIAVVEPFAAGMFRKDELAVRRFRPRIEFEIWAMTPAHRPRSLIVEEFIQFMRSFVEGHENP